jgi:hypothetical protein
MTAAQRKRLPRSRSAGDRGIQLAKSTSSKGQVFTNRGKTRKSKNPATRTKQKLTRVTFVVSRLMEFCTRRKLVNQTGHDVSEWPLVVLKELVDNAIDACEGLDGILAEVRANTSQPVIAVLHLACPRVTYTDRGKSAIVVEGGGGAL